MLRLEESHLEVQIVSQLVSPLSHLNIQQNKCAIKRNDDRCEQEGAEAKEQYCSQ